MTDENRSQANVQAKSYMTNIKHKKNGHLLPKEADALTWEKIDIDLISHDKIHGKGQPDQECKVYIRLV